MDKNGIKYNIVKTYKNGVRVVNVPNHWRKSKQSGTQQSWFPKSWNQNNVVRAAEHVCGLKKNRCASDGTKIYGKYKGVWVVVIKTHGNVATVFLRTVISQIKLGEANYETIF